MLSLATPKLDCSSLQSVFFIYLLQSKRKCCTVSGALQSGHFPSLCLPNSCNLKRVSFSRQLPTRSL